MSYCEHCGRPPADGYEAVIEDDHGTTYAYVVGCGCNRCEDCGHPCGPHTYCSDTCAANDGAWESLLDGPEGEEATCVVTTSSEC